MGKQTAMAARELTPVDLDRISRITYACSVFRVPGSSYAGGIITFTGDYRPGSAGFSDALFIKWKINEFCDIDEPARIYGLVVDFRGLQYEWGEDLDVPAARLRRGKMPVLSVVNSPARAAYAYCIEEAELREDFDAAVDEVANALSHLK